VARDPRHRRADAVGEHSDEVLLAAGYSEPEIRSMRAEGVLG
jgi:crotonobetainyl-CoA:carnitine CoA-transferase CaiB-like acyl-CoA transferase